MSAPRWRLRLAVFVPASMSCPAIGTFAEVFTLWASSTHVLGSASPPSASRTRRWSSPVSRAKTPSACLAAKESVDGLPGREVVREVAPGDAGAVHVHDGIHDAARVVPGRAPDVQAPAVELGAPGGQRGFDQLPAGVG